MALMAEHDDARQASRQCARTCGALARVRRACWWRDSRRSLRLRVQWGFSRIREISRHQAQARNTPVMCEAAAAILASEGPAPVSVGRQHARSSCDFAQYVSECSPENIARFLPQTAGRFPRRSLRHGRHQHDSIPSLLCAVAFSGEDLLPENSFLGQKMSLDFK